MVVCDGESSGQMGLLRPWSCRRDSMGLRAELLWWHIQLLGGRYRSTRWEGHSTPWLGPCLVFVGETAARLAQVRVIPQNTKGALGSCA